MAIMYVLLCELYILSDKICWKVTLSLKTSTFVNFTSQVLHHHA